MTETCRMVHKKTKSNSIKTIIVECKVKDILTSEEFEIDNNIFDDVYLEASTRFVENYIKNKNSTIAPILTAYEKKNKENLSKYLCYNSYFVIINAGFHKKAEIMRKNFKVISGIDLKTEKIKGEIKKENGNDK